MRRSSSSRHRRNSRGSGIPTNPRAPFHFALRTTAVATAVTYVLWNLFWLIQIRVPPSLFLGLTGLPGPTTGGMRSAACLLQGDWRGSLAYNAMTLPLAGLFAFCLALLAVQALRRRRLHLPGWTLWAWLGLLTCAWAIKLAGSPASW